MSRLIVKELTVEAFLLLIDFLRFQNRNLTIIERAKFIVRERGGILGLYRGIAPGSLRSFVGNGSAMVVMQYLQKKVTELGLRDS
jgi:solute carrier family 25 carnitine/acylcarnitine transporter 20/29